MKFESILWNFLTFLVIYSMMIFFIGLFETVRIDYMFTIAEDNFMNAGEVSAEILNDYFNVKNTYIFTNTPFILFMNFIGMVFIFYLMYNSWIRGRLSPPMRINEVFTSYSILMILSIYFIFIIAQYLINIFVDQLIIVLFSDIYNSIYMYQLFVDWFIFLILIAYFLNFIANYIKHFDIINN